MRVTTEHGWTEVHFTDLAALCPSLQALRDGYRKAVAEGGDPDDSYLKVLQWCSARFGVRRYTQDFESVCGAPRVTPTGEAYEGNESIRKWNKFVASKDRSYFKWYYDPEIVAKCAIGEDES